MRNNKGYTLIEIIVAIALMGVLLAIAAPNMVEWMRNAGHREAARNLLLQLRETRSLSIQRNLEYNLRVDIATRQMILEEGNRSANSSVYTTRNSEILGTDLILYSGSACDKTAADVAEVNFHFNPNGSSSTGYVCIMTNESPPVRRFRIGIPIGATGRATLN